MVTSLVHKHEFIWSADAFICPHGSNALKQTSKQWKEKQQKHTLSSTCPVTQNLKANNNYKLILEPHTYELHESTYMWIQFSANTCTVSRSAVGSLRMGWNWLSALICAIVYRDFSIWGFWYCEGSWENSPTSAKGNLSFWLVKNYMWIFYCVGGRNPKPLVVQRSWFPYANLIPYH